MMEDSKTDLRGIRILLWLTLADCCAAIVTSGLSLGTMGQVYGVAPGIGDVITYLQQIHSFLAFFLGWMCLAFLFGRGHREQVVKICCWAVLIVTLLHIAPFFTDTVFYMNTVSFSAGLNYFSAYVPGLMVAITYVALLTSWNETDPRRTNRVALVCGLIAVFMLIVYLAQVFPLMELTSTLHDNAQLWGLVFGNTAITLCVVLVWAITMSKRVYERLMYDMTDEEAFAFEIVAERVDAASQRIEADVERELAADAAQEEMFAEAGGVDGIIADAEAKETEPDSHPLLDRWNASAAETRDPMEELWRPEKVEEEITIEEEEPEEEPQRRGRFVPASENRPGTRLPRRDDPQR